MLERLAKETPEKYATFWREFGSVLKEGLAEDPSNRERIAELLRFSSTRSAGDEQDRSLADYVANAKSEQDVIYYLPADSLSAARSSPHLEALKQRDVEVLLLTDRLGGGAMQISPAVSRQALQGCLARRGRSRKARREPGCGGAERRREASAEAGKARAAGAGRRGTFQRAADGIGRV